MSDLINRKEEEGEEEREEGRDARTLGPRMQCSSDFGNLCAQTEDLIGRVTNRFRDKSREYVST